VSAAPGVVGVVIIVSAGGAYCYVSSSSLELSDWGLSVVGSSSEDLGTCSSSDRRLSLLNLCMSGRMALR
jgi:hypothetical protein